MKKYIFFLITFLFALSLTSQCEDNGNLWNDSWVSCEKSTNPNPLRGESHWLLYEFESIQRIDSTHFWNANRQGESGWGVKELIIDYSEDGILWNELDTFLILRGSESDDYLGVQGPNLVGLALKKILITVISTYENSNCASLAEVQLKIDESACFGLIDICGVCNGPGELIWYLDADGDGQGDENIFVNACEPPDGYVSNNLDLCDNGDLGWENVNMLFIENGCIECHGNNAAGGLDLRYLDSTLKGGNLCGSNILVEDVFVEIISTSNFDRCGFSLGPSMNERSSGEFDAEELAVLQKWIDGGAPELCTEFSYAVDVDQDGFNDAEDCDDNNPNVNPDETEVTYNGIDDDCDPATLDDDLDQDGFVFSEDCDDNNPNVNPDETEVTYNGIDDDCDPATLDDDLDQDGFVFSEDCDDNNPDINPDAIEIANNGIDEDCDGEDFLSATHEPSDKQISFFPNPVRNNLYIQTSNFGKFIATLYDSEGKKILQENSPLQIEMTNLVSGVYIIFVHDLESGNQYSEKILLIR